MFIKFSIDGRITVEDRGNFRAFKLVVEGSPARLDAARRALRDFVDLPDQTTAWVFEAALRAHPDVARDKAWQDQLGTMVEKARPHGWIDEQRQAIKAHIEWTQPA